MSDAQFWSLWLMFLAQFAAFVAVSVFSSYRDKETIEGLQSIQRHMLALQVDAKLMMKAVGGRDGDTLKSVMEWTREQFENLIAMKMVIESPQNAPALMQQVRLKKKEASTGEAVGKDTPPSPSVNTKEQGVTFVRSTG